MYKYMAVNYECSHGISFSSRPVVIRPANILPSQTLNWPHCASPFPRVITYPSPYLPVCYYQFPDMTTGRYGCVIIKHGCHFSTLWLYCHTFVTYYFISKIRQRTIHIRQLSYFNVYLSMREQYHQSQDDKHMSIHFQMEIVGRRTQRT